MRPRLKIAIRFDSGETLGYGHAKRCTTIARAFMDAGCDVKLICRKGRDAFVESNPLAPEVLWIGDDFLDCADNRELNLRDAEMTVAACTTADYMQDLTVLDQYELDRVWEKRLKAFCGKILVIEDYLERRHCADFVTGASLSLQNPAFYENVAATTFLLGREYLILGKEFQPREIRPLSNRRKKMLLFMGSADLTRATEKILSALMNSELCSGQIQSIHVIVGSCNSRAAEIRALTEWFSCSRFSTQLPTLADSMREADVCFLAGGNSMIEAIALGKPCVVIATAKNQIDLCNELAAIPEILYLGEHDNVTGLEIGESMDRIETFFNDLILPAAGITPIDTHGADRVVRDVLSFLSDANIRL